MVAAACWAAATHTSLPSLSASHQQSPPVRTKRLCCWHCVVACPCQSQTRLHRPPAPNMAMSHFPSLVAITHVRTTSTASARGASHQYTIIADGMFSSRGHGVSKISKRKPSSLSPNAPPRISTAKLALASEPAGLVAPPGPGTPTHRRIVRRKLGLAVSGMRAMSDTPQPPDGDVHGDADVDASATADSDDESTLVGADHSTHTEVEIPWPKALGEPGLGLTQRSVCQPPHMVSRKIMEHIAEFSHHEEDPDPDRKDDDDAGVATDPVAKASKSVPFVPWSLGHTHNPDYEICVEARTIVYHTELSPPPWHRQRRMANAFVFEEDVPSSSS
ncbi:hypothetical protein BJ912DRAFT_118151 [Pholiota molesta]|nr:hypothetical protein BJ912DRAFT_118151 [Pholiota molesta]